MTVYGVIIAGIVRKVKALVAEYRKLVAEATVVEKKLFRDAKSEAEVVITAAEAAEKTFMEEAKAVIMKAEAHERLILDEAKSATAKLKNELIAKISKI